MKWISACVAGLMAATTLLAPATAEAATERTYLQFNMAGKKLNNGDPAVADAVAKSVKDRMPSVVTLNEVCKTQYDELEAELEKSGYHATFGPTGPKCKGKGFGNAIFVHNSVKEYQNYKLPRTEEETETRKMLCVKATAHKSMACVTHLSQGRYKEERARQVGFIATKVGEFEKKGYRVIVGGDFNTEPRAGVIDPMYARCHSPKGSGLFYEADSERCGRRTGAATVDGGGTGGEGKIDYLFFSKGYSKLSAQVVPVSVSDHHLLWAKASR
ncbi:endonuclease/exonuclease/phosphatase family protein [Prauserella cavernicola]|uniref:Endonuclease/exonuclease/phosphatase family protein n=1 Tax=Prauserella cavernicola TaxID=2800127 RepID=A0A934V6I5_9PSEU|nr:endonuclease/exonuclease/phosphatase family protein [Prauserella cavernicola]MBK1787572.1 endonuclease/exonuclease/phosphatase family protein [Prauserella cavernicola]